MKKRIHILVTGKVQGVYFRQSAQERALSLGLTGFVQNNIDGSVMLEAEGPSVMIDQLVQWCKTGPPAARVTKVLVQEIPMQNSEDFTIRRAS